MHTHEVAAAPCTRPRASERVIPTADKAAPQAKQVVMAWARRVYMAGSIATGPNHKAMTTATMAMLVNCPTTRMTDIAPDARE